MKVGLKINYVCSVWITDLSCQMESAVTAPVSGHVKRVVVQEGMRYLVMIVSSLLTVCPGDSINQGDLTVEIVH